MSDLGHVLFGGVEGMLTSFATIGGAVFDGVPPTETRKPGVVLAVGTVQISAPLGREIGYLQVGHFRQPLLPRRRVWRSSPTQLIFPQPVPSRYWQLDVDAPPAAHARLDAVLSELCNFQSLTTVDRLELSDSEELYAGEQKETSPSPLVLDAINAIKLRSVPVSQASREINDKKLTPQRLTSNYQPFSSSRKSSWRSGSAPLGAMDPVELEPHNRPFTAPESHLITPETSGDLDIVEGPGSPTKAVISRFDYFDSVANELDSPTLSPLPRSPQLESLLDDDFVLGDPIEMRDELTGPSSEPHGANTEPNELTTEPNEPSTEPNEFTTEPPQANSEAELKSEAFEVDTAFELNTETFEHTGVELNTQAFVLSPKTRPVKLGAFDPSTPIETLEQLSPKSSLKTPESTLVGDPLFSPSIGPSARHSISSSSTLDEILELFTPDFRDLGTKSPEGPTMSELTQRNLVQFASQPPFPSLDRHDNVRFSHPLIPTPPNAVSYRMRSPRPSLPQNIHHDVTTVSGFIGWHVMNRILPPRR